MSNRRSAENGGIHDRVIDEIKGFLEKQGKYVVANPGQEKNPFGSVSRDNESVFPDLVIRPSKDDKITELIEVETEDSVDSEEVEQWKMYNAGESSFYLIVPEDSVEKAMGLINERGFSITGIGCYDVSFNIQLPEGA